MQHQPYRGGQWQVKGVALAVLGNRKGAILLLRMALFPYVPRGDGPSARDAAAQQKYGNVTGELQIGQSG